MNLKDTIFVITGASGATGSVIADNLHRAGAQVVGLNFRGEPRLSLTEQRTGFHALTLDLGNTAEVLQAYEMIKHHRGAISVWINTVGGFHMGQRVEDSEPDTWDQQWQVNFKTTLNTAQVILPHFREQGQGRLINFGSAAALDGLATAGPYIVSKAAVHALTRTIAAELEGDITCNAILPTTIDTPANRKAMPDADFSQWVTPLEIAAKIVEIIEGDMNGELIIPGSDG
ncbi:MAG: SDR family NAD(P)-dependent oxidoreductase [Candidatus Marinimicrobia bacterium]|nr:SDR family NAD(P)-dependent oxidoreductase [Candidatus Neomarinimicrobiota bacterium]